jgi:hypothetical protein
MTTVTQTDFELALASQDFTALCLRLQQYRELGEDPITWLKWLADVVQSKQSQEASIRLSSCSLWLLGR